MSRIKRSRLHVPIAFCIVAAGVFLNFQQPAWAKDLTLAWDANKENNLAGYMVYYKEGKSGDKIKKNYKYQVEVTLGQDEE